MEKSLKIGVVGIGMVGKPIVDYFAEQGYKRGKNLFCYDNDPKKKFSDDVSKADVIFVCVPTPANSDGSCNIKIVESVLNKFSLPNSGQEKIFVIKSTVEPGAILRLQKKYNHPLIFNPEFLTESRAREDFLKPDRQIAGFTNQSIGQASAVLALLPKAYFSSPGNLGTYNFIGINATEAEMGKYGANVFGAMKVVYANILADFCLGLEKALNQEGYNEKVDYENVRQVVAHDGRIGGSWLDISHNDYRGFGGFCFPKDLNAFISFAKKLEQQLSKKDKNKKLIAKGIVFLEAMRDYNIALLKSQGINIKDISSHNIEVEKIVKNVRKKKK